MKKQKAIPAVSDHELTMWGFDLAFELIAAESDNRAAIVSASFAHVRNAQDALQIAGSVIGRLTDVIDVVNRAEGGLDLLDFIVTRMRAAALFESVGDM